MNDKKAMKEFTDLVNTLREEVEFYEGLLTAVETGKAEIHYSEKETESPIDRFVFRTVESNKLVI